LIEEAAPKGAAFVAQGGRQDRGGFLRAREAARRAKARRNILRSDAQRGFAAPSRRERLGRTIPDCADARESRRGSGSRLGAYRNHTDTGGRFKYGTRFHRRRAHDLPPSRPNS